MKHNELVLWLSDLFFKIFMTGCSYFFFNQKESQHCKDFLIKKPFGTFLNLDCRKCLSSKRGTFLDNERGTILSN